MSSQKKAQRADLQRVPPATGAPPSRRRLKPWLLAAGGSVAIAVAAFFGMHWLGARGDPSPQPSAPPAEKKDASVDPNKSSAKTSGEPSPAAGQSADDGKPDGDPAIKAEVQAIRDEAMEIGRQMLRDFPKSSDAYGLLGMVCNRFYDTVEAMKYWQLVADVNPRRADVYEAMAIVANKNGKFDEAIDYCRMGLARSDNYPTLHSLLGEALNGLGKPAETVEKLEVAAKQFPKSPQIQLELGRAYALLQDYERAKAAYATAVELQPDFQSAQYGLALASKRVGDEQLSQQAMQRYQELRDKVDHDARLHRGPQYDLLFANRVLALACSDAGAVYFGRQKPERAEELWQRGTNADPKNTPCRIQLALIFMRSGRSAQAVPLVEQLTEIEPKNFEFFQRLALLQAQLGNRTAALAAAKKAAELAPDDPTSRRLVNDLQKQQ